MTWGRVLVALMVAADGGLLAQQPGTLAGTVLAAESGTPLVGAQVSALRARRSVTTDWLGRFMLPVSNYPDTVVAAFIGRAPDTLVVETSDARPWIASLQLSPQHLPSVVVTASDASRDARLLGAGQWHLPKEQLRTVPAAVEPDLLRSMVLVPAVSFSSPLSARPLIRGYEASESVFRIDGFEIVTPYHLGRAFSALPVQAVQNLAVVTSPAPADVGGTLSGVVDASGESGTAGGVHGGADLSFVSASGWLGSGGAVSGFGAIRAVHLSAVEMVTSNRIPYDFQDLYLSGLLGADSVPRGRITAFASRDRLNDRRAGSGMDWSNLLAASRWELSRGPSPRVTATLAASRFSEDGADVEAPHASLDVRNRFGRVGASLDAAWEMPRSRLTVGAAAGWRSIANRIAVTSGRNFPSVDRELSRVEFAAHFTLAQHVGRALVRLGARLDGAGSVSVLQPRMHVGVPISARSVLGLAVGRTARLHQLVSDPRPEPTLTFYDFWLPAGEAGVPTPVVDHAAIELATGADRLAVRVSVFGSRGRGLLELRPASDAAFGAADPFRSGRSRTAGVELDLGWGDRIPGRQSLHLSYIASRSEREWGDGWVRWIHDRTHLLRLSGSRRFGQRLTGSFLVEAASGAPVTPVAQVVLVEEPGPGGFFRAPRYVYGRESSATSSGTVRADVGFQHGFGGPAGTRLTLGLSVINLGFGPVAPQVPSNPMIDSSTDPPVIRVEYERLYDLPAVPTLTFRVEF